MKDCQPIITIRGLANRFGEQVETVTTDMLFESWPAVRRKGLIS